MTLAGRYSGHHGHGRPTHASQYVYYCSQIEKIHMKQIDEEFIKNADLEGGHHPQQPPTHPAAGRGRMSTMNMVPSPADAVPPPPARTETSATVGSDESEENTKAPPAPPDGPVQMLIREREAVSGGGDTRITILPVASEVPESAAVRGGTSVSTRTVQQEPAGSGDA
jgi:hypothetical protein